MRDPEAHTAPRYSGILYRVGAANIHNYDLRII